MHKFVENLKSQAEANPLWAVVIGAGAVKVVAQLMDANSRRRNAISWDRETERRRMNQK